MKLYGLGCYDEYDAFYDLTTVKMTICQPRINNISSTEMSAVDLLAWAEDELKPKADTAWKGEGILVPGDHCKFCKVKATCTARAEQNITLLEDFREEDKQLTSSHLLSPERIADVLNMTDEVKSWLKDIEEYALKQALEGDKFPGYKLVEGRSNRIYADEKEVAATLALENYTEEQVFNKKLKGITDMEKLLGKKLFTQLLDSYIMKPPGKPTLVVETDKRTELNNIAEEFDI